MSKMFSGGKRVEFRRSFGMKSSRAFTLVELIIGAMILSLLAALSLRLFQGGVNTQNKISQKLVLLSSVRRASDVLVETIRESSEVIRPALGETLPFLVVKDIRNKMAVYYLEEDKAASEMCKRTLFRLVSYTSPYGASYAPGNEKIMLTSLKELRFTYTAPGSLQINATVADKKNEFQFLSHVALMNLGDLE